jgi:hypothetical protein
MGATATGASSPGLIGAVRVQELMNTAGIRQNRVSLCMNAILPKKDPKMVLWLPRRHVVWMLVSVVFLSAVVLQQSRVGPRTIFTAFIATFAPPAYGAGKK